MAARSGMDQPQMSANGCSTGASLARELDDASVSRGEHAGLKIVSHGGMHHGGHQDQEREK